MKNDHGLRPVVSVWDLRAVWQIRALLLEPKWSEKNLKLDVELPEVDFFGSTLPDLPEEGKASLS